MAMNSSNTKTGQAATHQGKMPSSSTALASKTATSYGRGKPVTPEGSVQKGYRMDIPGQRS
jgi:hypothetical protein